MNRFKGRRSTLVFFVLGEDVVNKFVSSKEL